jgi:AAA family ATP:ADP antiporter
MRLAPANDSTLGVWTGRAFYVWTSAFNLFVVSIFWSFMADVFRSEQAKRLFGFIGVGGTLGSIVGSGVTASLASRIGSVNLLVVSSVLIELAVLTVVAFPQLSSGRAATRGDAPIGGRVWAGITDIARSPYLLVICGFLILYVIGSTFLYFEQSDIVGRTYLTRDARTTVLAQLELVAQALTVLTQLFFTGRIIRWIGLTATLAILPVVSILGFASLGLVPAFMTLGVFIVVRRATNFSLTNPAMEVLFTVVPREEKYKAKNFIETFVYRGGDQVAAWVYAGLAALGLGMAGISFAAVPLAGVWFGSAVWLGRRQARLAATSGDVAMPASMPVSVPSPA